MKDFTREERLQKLLNFNTRKDTLRVLYEWVKTGVVDVRFFIAAIEATKDMP